MIRTHYTSELLEHLGEPATIAGWVEYTKELPNLRFVILRDTKGLAQVTIQKKSAATPILKISEQLNPQDVISVSGRVAEKQIAKIGPEITPDSMILLNKSDSPLPLDVGGSAESLLDTRLDWRPLDLRNERNQSIFTIESKIIQAFQEYLNSAGFREVYTPTILGGISEGGAEVFKIDYFGSDAFLRQDPQLHRQLAIAGGMDKIYDLGTSWRAEKSHTPNHLCEHRVCAAEFGFLSDETDTERVEEKLVASAFERVGKDCKPELENLNVQVRVPPLPFPELRFPKIYDILREFGNETSEGEELNREREQILAKYVKEKFNHDFFFVNRFPFEKKPFYVMRVDEDPRWARSVDLVYRGVEVSSGGQREHRYGKLLDQVKIKEMKIEQIDWFLKHFKYGVPPHGGFAIGLERTVMQLLDVQNIREVVLFPRTPERLVP